MDEDLLASVMGFSGIVDPEKIMLVWKKWQQSTKLTTRRKHLIRGIKAWATATGIAVDPCTFFTKQQIDDFVAGNFNPGGYLALYVSCDRGVTLLTCMGKSLAQ